MAGACARSRLVARRGDLPDLSALLQDTNGDGIGDLPGITERLDYVAELGVDAIWLSPFFNSPMKDFGYDVSDYRDVDPLFGTLADFDAPDRARRTRSACKVMIDQVISHTSDQHPWFLESRLSRDQSARPTGMSGPTPSPTARRPTTGCRSSAARPGTGTRGGMQYYLHNFLAEQPDLNFHNPDGAGRAARRDALLARSRRRRLPPRHRSTSISTTRGLRGQSGRCRREDRNDQTAPAVNPYNFQEHLYDKSQPENLGFLKRFRAAARRVSGRRRRRRGRRCAARGSKSMAAYTAGGDKLHMAYTFDFLAPRMISARTSATVLEAFEQGGQRRLGVLGVFQP